MPCFKGIAVSIHSNGAPLPEHGIQKQSKFSRISTYIPVPPPRIGDNTDTPDPARFAISITLLTPDLAIPYSTPKPTEANPKPKPQYAGSGKVTGGVAPYIPMTHSPNETIAAYIYFDGRGKEEVATLLRPGEETWVNSRWVQVPESEGGGLAEREFLFKEVGLERWLNGLDLQGDDAQAKIERRRKKFEKRRRRQKRDEDLAAARAEESNGSRDVLRYGADDGSPVQALSDESDSFSDDDDDELPEATGQIKVAMFRVLASGEIKKGEYSPQFDAHDDDEDLDQVAQDSSANLGADIEHTTSFAKPKTLDPSTISTQTVTGIDGPEKPYATFTFFYRGERQLQKIGVLSKGSAQQQTPGSSKRRSAQLDFSNLGPLKTSGTVGFTAFRDADGDASKRRKARKKSNGIAGGAMEDSDEDDDDENDLIVKMEDIDEKDTGVTAAPADTGFPGELADGVDRMRLKRAHSADPSSEAAAGNSNADPQPSLLGTDPSSSKDSTPGPMASAIPPGSKPEDSIVGSPMKKHRPSVSGPSAGLNAMNPGVSGLDTMLSGVSSTQGEKQPFKAGGGNVMEEEEL